MSKNVLTILREPRCKGADLLKVKFGLRRNAFSILELLMVVGLIALLMGLMAPAMRGMLGVSGRRGGVSVVVNLTEQARLAAIENGVRAYVAFAPTNSDPEVRFNSLIVLREKKPNEVMAGNVVALTKWVRLPQGVFYDGLSNMVLLMATNFPRLEGSSTTGRLTALQFDQFGRFFPRTGAADPSLRVGEGGVVRQGASYRVAFRGESYDQLTINRLTGRMAISSP